MILVGIARSLLEAKEHAKFCVSIILVSELSNDVIA